MSDYEVRHKAADAAEERRLYAGITDSIYQCLEDSASRSSIIASLKAIKHGHKFGDNRVCRCGLSEKNYLATAESDLPLSVCEACCHEPT